jgi:hypothetical protein
LGPIKLSSSHALQLIDVKNTEYTNQKKHQTEIQQVSYNNPPPVTKSNFY